MKSVPPSLASPAPERKNDERLLIMAPVGQDAAAMAAMLESEGFQTQTCEGPPECAWHVAAGAGSLLLTEEALDHPQISELLAALQAQPAWSELPVIILTSGGEPRLRKLMDLTAAAARAATVLERPLGKATLVRSVQVALNSRRRQYQVRYLLEEQERSHRQLQQSEDQLRFVTNNASALIVHCDARGRFIFVNEPYAQRYGLRPKDIVGKHISDIVGVAAFETFRCYVEKVLRGERADFELKIPYDTLGPRWVHGVFAPDVKEGVVVGFVGLIQDVTARREAEEAQARLAAIVTSSSDAILSKTLEGIVTSWNAGAEQIFGYAPEEMIGQSILRLIPDELKGEEDTILARLKKGERIDHYETIRMTKEGRRLAVSLTISPIQDASGQLIGASKIARDISEWRAVEESLRLAKEQAETASRAKDHFLAALSHELRTPLTPVLMAAAALREDPRLPADVREDLGMIERNISLEARLIDDLLDLTRIARGKLSLRTEPCDAHSLIGLVVDIVREEAREKSIDIALDLSARHSSLTGDPTRLQQVFWNLLRNAVKFTPVGGHVRIHSHDGTCGNGHGDECAARVCIAVSDDGIGLDAAALGRIFEPFEQASPGSEHRFGGLGLGLAIARAIVDLHAGSIRAESPGPGQGSTFTVELPASIPSQESSTWARPSGAGAHGEGSVEPPMRLLLVEDHKSTLQVLTRLLTRAGHHVTGTNNLAAARAAAATHSFDAVISDLGLPDGTGIALLGELRAAYGLRGIILSGYGMEDDLRRSLSAGCVAHLVKPVDINELRRVLRQLAPAPVTLPE